MAIALRVRISAAARISTLDTQKSLSNGRFGSLRNSVRNRPVASGRQESRHEDLAAKRIYQFVVMLDEHEDDAGEGADRDSRNRDCRKPLENSDQGQQQNENDDAGYRVGEILRGIPGLVQEGADRRVRQDQSKKDAQRRWGPVDFNRRVPLPQKPARARSHRNHENMPDGLVQPGKRAPEGAAED